ncbi:hypothetical protein ACFC5X_30510, partial [Streptomyces sp. NPDC055952]
MTRTGRPPVSSPAADLTPPPPGHRMPGTSPRLPADTTGRATAARADGQPGAPVRAPGGAITRAATARADGQHGSPVSTSVAAAPPRKPVGGNGRVTAAWGRPPASARG